jgi:hypothetical protein
MAVRVALLGLIRTLAGGIGQTQIIANLFPLPELNVGKLV